MYLKNVFYCCKKSYAIHVFKYFSNKYIWYPDKIALLTFSTDNVIFVKETDCKKSSEMEIYFFFYNRKCILNIENMTMLFLIIH